MTNSRRPALHRIATNGCAAAPTASSPSASPTMRRSARRHRVRGAARGRPQGGRRRIRGRGRVREGRLRHLRARGRRGRGCQRGAGGHARAGQRGRLRRLDVPHQARIPPTWRNSSTPTPTRKPLPTEPRPRRLRCPISPVATMRGPVSLAELEDHDAFSAATSAPMRTSRRPCSQPRFRLALRAHRRGDSARHPPQDAPWRSPARAPRTRRSRELRALAQRTASSSRTSARVTTAPTRRA